MKNFFIMACVLIMSCVGCAKEEKGCTPVAPQSEEAKIQAYATAKGISAVKHNSGIFYEVITPGSGAPVTGNSKVFITYSGKLLNDYTFDGTDNPAITGWTLNELIEGWQIGLPLIKKGGRIKLIIPSALAYGCNGSGRIGPNEVLFFDISLVDVQ